MQAQGDCDQGCPEGADSGPAGEFPSEARAQRADRPAHKHSAHEDRVQPVTRFRATRIDDVLRVAVGTSPITVSWPGKAASMMPSMGWL